MLIVLTVLEQTQMKHVSWWWLWHRAGHLATYFPSHSRVSHTRLQTRDVVINNEEQVSLAMQLLPYNQIFLASCWRVETKKKKKKKKVYQNPLARHAMRWWVHLCAYVHVTTPQMRRPVSDREANWQAQTHRSGESMGPARAYLLPMMKPNTMNTRMMVPATATTAMMMTGFCSLETIAAGRRTETHGQTGREKHTDVRVNLCTSKDQDRRYIIEPALRVIAQPRSFFSFFSLMWGE